MVRSDWLAMTASESLVAEAELAEVRDAVASVGRRHLRIIVGGVVLDMIREALLPREAVLHVLVMAFRGLDGIFGGGGGWPELVGMVEHTRRRPAPSRTSVPPCLCCP